jgi:F-type H+-transporting ATPase subunit epsilon
MQLKILTPQDAVLDQAVDSVTVPGALGELQILPGHTYLLSLVQKGELRYESESGNGGFTVTDGHAEICDDVITVAVNSAS